MHAMMRIKPRRLMSHVNRPRHDIHDMARHDMTLHDMTWLAWHGMEIPCIMHARSHRLDMITMGCAGKPWA